MQTVVRGLLATVIGLGSFVACGALLGNSAANAGEGAWVRHSEAVQSRLVSASMEKVRDGKIMLAWEAELADGWKTYWRSPGEAGLPVDIYVGDDEVDTYYPLPKKFELFGIQTYGYGKSLTLPFEVDVAAAQRGVDVRVEFMVCNDICIPFKQTFAVDAALLAADSPLVDIRLDAWLKKVPQRGEGAYAGLAIEDLSVRGRPGFERLIVDVALEDRLATPQLLVEADEGFQLAPPKLLVPTTPGRWRFVVPVMVRDDSLSIRDRAVRLTLSDNKGNAIDRIIKQ